MDKLDFQMDSNHLGTSQYLYFYNYFDIELFRQKLVNKDRRKHEIVILAHILKEKSSYIMHLTNFQNI